MGTVSISKTTDGKTITKQIKEYAWNLLGKNKDGWVANTDQNITDLKKPETGEKKIDVLAVEKTKSFLDSLTTGNNPNQSGDHLNKTDNKETELPKIASKNEGEFFAKTVELNLTKSDIKNYFDTKDVKYSNAISLDKLKVQLGEMLNYNLEELTKAFK